jgi:hypothetical protein
METILFEDTRHKVYLTPRTEIVKSGSNYTFYNTQRYLDTKLGYVVNEPSTKGVSFRYE